jgi:hypothetical protein
VFNKGFSQFGKYLVIRQVFVILFLCSIRDFLNLASIGLLGKYLLFLCQIQ